MNTGIFAAMDQRELIANAISWCEAQLDDIDQAVNQA